MWKLRTRHANQNHLWLILVGLVWAWRVFIPFAQNPYNNQILSIVFWSQKGNGRVGRAIVRPRSPLSLSLEGLDCPGRTSS